MGTEERVESGEKTSKTLVRILATALTLSGGVIAIYSFMETHSSYDLSGEWKITNTIASTSYNPFQGIKLGYRVFLMQHGRDITGTGEKWTENDKWLPPLAHTPIKITGSITGNKIAATFEETGTKRKSTGTFDWIYKAGSNSLAGSFTSTAANSSGSSVGTRVVH